MISFVVPGQPVAKQRHRGAILKQCRKCGKKTARNYCLCGSQEFNFLTTLEHTPKETKQYENLVRLCAQEAMKRGHCLLSGSVILTCSFYFLIPMSRRKKLREGMRHCQRPDLDNCIKSILDGCNSVVWTDDSIVTEISADKFWSLEPRAEVNVI